MAKLHLYPVFHVALDVERGCELPELVARQEASLAAQLRQVEFTFGEDCEYVADFTDSFDASKTNLIVGRRATYLRPIAPERVLEFVEQLDSLIDGETDELAQLLAPIRDFLSQLNISRT